MRWNVVFGIARAEARLTRRLVRYWVFLGLAALMVAAAYLYYGAIHAFFSSYSASVGSISPRYLMSGLAFWAVVLFLVGLIFLAFDVRARDQRERIVEVLDSRPCNNLELVTGRYLGLLFMSWLPLAAMIVAVQLVGLLAAALGWRLGEPIEPWSVFGFVFLISIPALAFILGLCFLAAIVLRRRLATALAMLVFLAGSMWAMFQMPIDLVSLVDINGGYTLSFPSELVPEPFAMRALIQRAAVLVAGVGLLLLAAAAHPRLDSSPRKAWAGAGAVLLVLALAGELVIYRQSMDARAQFAAWKAAHEARRDEPAPDLERMSGEVTIDPGRSLAGELEIDFAAPPDAALDHALFTLNPGLAVERVADASGGALEFSHRDGLLDVTLGETLAAGAGSSVSLTFGGSPDTAFADLDAALQIQDLELTNANIVLLGFWPAIFDRRYVALMPDVRWLPAAGADVGRGDPQRPPDYFHLDLTVALPAGWLAAGPGRRQEVEGAPPGEVRYRFAPAAPLPEAALVASRFASRAAEVAGVELEILLHPRHTKNLEVLADAGDEIRSWVAEHLDEAAAIGLPYPYEALTMVEVPTTLRAFGGGWRMDSVLAPPAMLLVKETGFPTTRFDNRFRHPEEFEDREGGIAAAKREVLESFFESDLNGGNIFLGAARNFFLYQTASHGEGALALDFVCNDLTNRLTTGKEGFFSAHIFGSGFQQLTQNVIVNYLTQRNEGITITEATLQAVTDRPEVWDQALGTSLAAMDPWEDPSRTVDVLALKGKAISRWILDGLGRDKAGELVAALRRRAAGRSFDQEDLHEVAAELGIDLEGLVGDWLEQTALPGFVASEPRLFRLPDSDDGTPRYQLALDLRNDEPAPGLARLRYRLADSGQEDADRGGAWQESEPLRVEAGESVEVGLVLSKPPRALEVAPYLSLNRGAFAVPLPTLDEEKIVETEPVAGVRPSDWRRADGDAIVVDDLDEAFAVEQDEERSGLRLGVRAQEQTLDQGLPVMANPFQLPGEWSRRTESEAWGKYRRTIAVIKAGKGGSRAVFHAELPRSGPWRLELYMLPARALRWKLGTYHLTAEDSSGSHQLTFDAAAAEEGWNSLGELEMAAGEARVVLSDETDGRAVVADAIRLRPLGSTRVQEETTDE